MAAEPEQRGPLHRRGTQPGTLDTGSAGSKSFTVTAIDRAGNTVNLTRHYTVGN